MIRLSDDHPAVVEGRTVFTHLVREPSGDEWILKSGEHNRKLGSHVAKKKWKGFPIFSLSLEERATCPQTCEQWTICYGNHASQHKAYRYRHGPNLEQELGRELFLLATEAATRRGFVVRLHALGDFYSTDYVDRWAEWLRQFKSLKCFGYTAWPRDSEIGSAIENLTEQHWERFAIRFSEQSGALRSAGVVSASEPYPSPTDAIICPAETGATACCGTCGLCWTTEKRIVFIEH